MKYLFPILWLLLFSCQKQHSTSAPTERPIRVFVQSDSVLMGEKIMDDDSIRKDNFYLDKDASPEELPSLYRAYDVVNVKPGDNIYLIKTKESYAKARTFFRLIRFNKKGKQVAARTFVDYQFQKLVKLESGYRLQMEKPVSGAAWDKKGSAYEELLLGPYFNIEPKEPIKVFVQSDFVLMGEKMMRGDSIRQDNFYLDKDASPEDLPSLYRAYDVDKISEGDNIYLIKTKLLYAKARTFFRLIRFNKKGKQVAARTFVDYQCIGLIKLKDGYCLGLRKPISGVDWGEKEKAYQVLFLDKNFKTRIQKLPCASAHEELLEISLNNDTIKLNVRVYMGCTICNNEMWYYTAKFSPAGDYWGGHIYHHSIYPKADSTLFEETVECLRNKNTQ